MHCSVHAVFETGEELSLGTCGSRGVFGVGVLVNTHLAMNIDSYESLTTRIGSLRLRRCGSTPALTIFVVHAPTSSYDEEEVDAFYMDLKRLYKEDHTFLKVIVGDFNAKIGSRRTAEELHVGTHGMKWNEQDERLSEFIMSTHTVHATTSTKSTAGSLNIFTIARRAVSLEDVKKRLSSKTLELICQREIGRAAGNEQLTSKLAKQCREAIKEDLKERRAAAMDEAVEAGKSIRQARWSLSIKYQDDFPSSSRRNCYGIPKGKERAIHDFYSDLFESLIYMPTHPLCVNVKARRIRRPFSSSFRDSIHHLVDEEWYSTRSRQDQSRTSKEPPASHCQNPGPAFHAVPVAMQSAQLVEN
uniref:Endonuclease exonuclease phosphatase domain containing protein n=1 Tax=Haemonchus contortus TaxID=6289 RepID=A0A7I4YEX8_HAECO